MLSLLQSTSAVRSIQLILKSYVFYAQIIPEKSTIHSMACVCASGLSITLFLHLSILTPRNLYLSCFHMFILPHTSFQLSNNHHNKQNPTYLSFPMAIIKSFFFLAVLSFLAVSAYAGIICKYKDACTKKPIWGLKNGMIIDECKNVFKINRACRLKKIGRIN